MLNGLVIYISAIIFVLVGALKILDARLTSKLYIAYGPSEGKDRSDLAIRLRRFLRRHHINSFLEISGECSKLKIKGYIYVVIGTVILVSYPICNFMFSHNLFGR